MKHEINRRKNSKITTDWCGPSAVAIVTGCTIDHAAATFAKVHATTRYQYSKTARQVKGVYNHELHQVMAKLGWELHPVDGHKNKTLFRYMQEQNTAEFRSRLIIQVTRHYVVAHKGRISDNHELDRDVVTHQAKLKKIRNMWIAKRIR